MCVPQAEARFTRHLRFWTLSQSSCGIIGSCVFWKTYCSSSSVSFLLWSLKFVLTDFRKTVCPRYSCRPKIVLTEEVPHRYGLENFVPLYCSGWYFFAYAAGIRTFSSVNSSAIVRGLFPSFARRKIRFTTSDATGSTTSVCLSFGKRLYPYGIEPLQRFPSFIRASNTALILLLVSLAYHSFIIFKNGAKSLSEALLLSMLLLIARNRTFFCGNRTSV